MFCTIDHEFWGIVVFIAGGVVGGFIGVASMSFISINNFSKFRKILDQCHARERELLKYIKNHLSDEKKRAKK